METTEPGKGKGLKANRSYTKDETIVLYATKSSPLSELTSDNYIHAYIDGELYLGDGPGRLVNDPMLPKKYDELLKCQTVAAVSKWWDEYEYGGNAGCRVEGGQLMLFALEDIKEGQYINMSYSPAWWLNMVILNSSASPYTKLSCCLHLLDNQILPAIIGCVAYITASGDNSIAGSEEKIISPVAEIERLSKFFGFPRSEKYVWAMRNYYCREMIPIEAKVEFPDMTVAYHREFLRNFLTKYDSIATLPRSEYKQ